MPTTAQLEARRERRKRSRFKGTMRSKSQLAADRRNVAELYLKGHGIMQIAALLGMSHSTVSADLAYLRDEWVKCAAKSFDQKRAEQLERLDKLEREAWHGWERSQQHSEKHIVKTTNAPPLPGATQRPGPSRTESTAERVDRIGDPRFLNLIREIIIERARLLGLHEPEEVSHTHTLQVKTTREQLPPAAVAEMDSETRRQEVLALMAACTPPETFTRDTSRPPDMDVPCDDRFAVIDVEAEVIEIERETPARPANEPKEG